MSLIGLDLNATRARAVQSPLGTHPMALRLDGEQRDLVLALSLAERRVQVGRAGLGLCRRQPQVAVVDFLPALGSTQRWTAGRHKLDARAALAVCMERLQTGFGKAEGVALAVPAYLQDRAINLIHDIARKGKWSLLGSVAAPLAAVRWAYQRHPWVGVALVGDVDGGAFTWSAVSTDGDQARLLEVQSYPRLNRTAWVMRLLDGVANRCIRLSRRDPRQIPETEQALYDQLVTVLDGSSADRTVEFNLRTSQWAQHLAFQTSELIAVCIPLVDEVAARMKQCLRMLPTHAQVQVILLTAAAAALPGLRATLESRFRGDPTLQSQEDTKDFGEGLMLEGWMLAGEVQVLDADAVAAGAHDLACAFKRGELVAGHLDGVRLIRPSQAPPLEPSLPDDGPARLQFRGQEHPLVGETFTLGRDPNCSLVFEAEHYPQVASCHCDIVLDRRSYMLRDRSRLGTLVNERPVQRSVALHSGDWIRLGPDGPVLRFLGQATSLRPYRETE